MNALLLQFVAKTCTLLIVSVASFFGIIDVKETKYTSKNVNESLNTSVVNQVINYDTSIIYNSKRPSNIKTVLTKGQNGVKTYTNGEEIIIKEPITEVIEQGTGSNGNFVGKITGYGPDCPGCSSVGNVACHTKAKQNHSLINDGVFYTDEEYGKVHILAASREVFPCGTIVEFSDKNNKYIGVVLDSGSAMRNAWSQNRQILFDLAYESQEKARSGFIHGNNIKYSVQRWGW